MNLIIPMKIDILFCGQDKNIMLLLGQAGGDKSFESNRKGPITFSNQSFVEIGLKLKVYGCGFEEGRDHT
jgi:hypothetical protein